MSEHVGLRVLIDANAAGARAMIRDLRKLARRADVRYKWKIKWATSRRAWRNRPREREFVEFQRPTPIGPTYWMKTRTTMPQAEDD